MDYGDVTTEQRDIWLAVWICIKSPHSASIEVHL